MRLRRITYLEISIVHSNVQDGRMLSGDVRDQLSSLIIQPLGCIQADDWHHVLELGRNIVFLQADSIPISHASTDLEDHEGRTEGWRQHAKLDMQCKPLLLMVCTQDPLALRIGRIQQLMMTVICSAWFIGS